MLEIKEKEEKVETNGSKNSYWTFNLLSIKPINSLMRKRWYQPLLMGINLIFFAIVIFAGIFGSTVGNANFSVIFVWIVWWAALIMFLVPFLGRFWCTICPIPAVGEWFQRGGPISKGQKKERLRGLNKRWPKRFRNMWIATFGFLSIAIFSGLVTTIPKITGYLLLGLILVGVGISFVFRKRAFCRYVCPVGGFIGLYSQASALELRVKDSDVCRGHRPKDCLIGNEKGFSCPWGEYPGNLETNTYCGLCMECFKVCSEDNIALNLRPFGADLSNAANPQMDEAYKANVMLGSAMLYSVVLLGPYGTLKDMANFASTIGMLKYAGLFLGVLLVVIPSFFWLSAFITKSITTRKDIKMSTIFKNFAYSTVPMGLMTWIGFSLLILLPNWVYIVNVINDPFGWGWKLLGIEALKWKPVLTGSIPYALSVFIIAGLYLAIRLTNSISDRLYENNPKDSYRAFLVHVVFLTIFTFGLLYAFVG